jgi:hypothetical protein
MAFFSFGKKDKNPPQLAAPLGQTPPGEVPKIQTPPSDISSGPVTIPPPVSNTLPTIKPPQPSGLMPASGVGRNTITTQPMGMPPRPATPPGAEPPKNRSTERLVVAPYPGSSLAASRSLQSGSGSDVINLPAGMILRCLPAEMLAAPLSEFEASGAAAAEVALPLNSILSQLPSGKVELPVRDVIARFPPGFIKPEEEIAPHLASTINLPLMDVVMRIPPDMLAVRADQKDVDASVKRMADPFAGSGNPIVPSVPAVPAGEARIVEEGQEPGSEEFVPQHTVPPPATATRSFVPPPRHPSRPLLSQTETLSGRPVAQTAAMPGRVTPATEEVPVPPAPTQLSASQILGVPRPALTPPAFSPLAGATASGPIEPRVPVSGITPPPGPPRVSPATPPVTNTTVMPASARPTPAPPAQPEANADELQRLAMLAMAQTGDQPVGDEAPPAETGPTPEVAAPADQATMPLRAIKPDAAASPQKIDPGFGATSRVQPAPQPSRGLAQTAALLPALNEPVRASSPAEPIRLPSQDEPIRSPLPLQESVKPPGIEESIGSSGFETASISAAAPEPALSAQEEAPAAPAATAINLNNCAAEDLLPIPGITLELARNIVQHRDKIGEFHKLEELLDVPGMTGTVYSNLTGETPSSGVHPSINELLGFPLEQELSLKDITDRISCWPDVTGCLLSQKNGLHLVGTAPDFLDKAAIVAFAPRLFEDVNKSFGEITNRETDELIIPTTGTSFHLLREKDLYLIILSRLPLMPERHLKIARFVLAGLSSRPS